MDAKTANKIATEQIISEDTYIKIIDQIKSVAKDGFLKTYVDDLPSTYEQTLRSKGFDVCMNTNNDLRIEISWENK